MNQPYNPLEKTNLAESVVSQLLAEPPQKMTQLRPFSGAGIYAIYYAGDFPAYKHISTKDLTGDDATPIYVGKAVPKGARKGLEIDTTGSSLYSRIKQHLGSVTSAKNLSEEDFYCRYLVVDDIWIPLAESLMINRFKPLWNVSIDGFGNHAPGGGRSGQKKSSWDTLHPGRAWADKLPPGLYTEAKIIELLERGQSVPESAFEASESAKDDA